MSKKQPAKGMALEKRVNACNLRYRKQKFALIEKIELGFRISSRGLIPLVSTVDYRGMIKRGDHTSGIAFDAKETKNKVSFPLKNIKDHQIEYLRHVNYIGGEAYLLIQFTELYQDTAFLTPISFIIDYWDNQFNGGPKSIKHDAFSKDWLVPIDDYLKLTTKTSE